MVNRRVTGTRPGVIHLINPKTDSLTTRPLYLNRALYSPLAGLLAVAAGIPRDRYEVVLTDENIESIDFDASSPTWPSAASRSPSCWHRRASSTAASATAWPPATSLSRSTRITASSSGPSRTRAGSVTSTRTRRPRCCPACSRPAESATRATSTATSRVVGRLLQGPRTRAPGRQRVVLRRPRVGQGQGRRLHRVPREGRVAPRAAGQRDPRAATSSPTTRQCTRRCGSTSSTSISPAGHRVGPPGRRAAALAARRSAAAAHDGRRRLPLDAASSTSPPRSAGAATPSTASLVLEVTDDFLGVGGGRFALEGGPTEATCKPTKKKADIALSVADLGAIYLGGNALSALARVGRIEEKTKGALARADAMFVTHPAPYCRTGF